MPVEGQHQQLDELFQAVSSGQVGGTDRLGVGDVRGDCGGDHVAEQVVLGSDVVIQRSAVDADPLGDVVQLGGMETLLAEHFARRVTDLALPFEIDGVVRLGRGDPSLPDIARSTSLLTPAHRCGLAGSHGHERS